LPDIVLAFGLIAVVLTVTGLISRVVDRSPLTMPLIFLVVGLLLGGPVLGIIDIEADDLSLED
jgi:NhaP-type Na+/H+ and K+/H+ antiporter